MSSKRFQNFSVGVLVYTLAVIAWGGYVRASGSGAGCGSHWPVCNGEVIPRSPTVQTLVEYSHRLTSGLSLLLVVALAIWAFRAHARGHVVRKSAAWAVVFILLEAAIGAGLVLLELVALDASVRRAIAMSMHLVNTFLLLSALGACAYHARAGDGRREPESVLSRLLRSSHFALAFVGASGSVAALGDTLTQHGVRSAIVDLLIRLRISHPVLAVASVVLIAFAASVTWRERPRARTAVRALVAVVVLQLTVGVLNVALQAPIWMQLVHLLTADLVWLALVFTSRAALWNTGAQGDTAAAMAPAISSAPRAA